MYPGRFEYFSPATLDEALATLDRFGDEAKVLAGGQSLIPLMKLRFASPLAVVDINRVEGLDGLSEEGGELRIGALVRHKACERSELMRGRWGVLGDAAPQISDPLVRNLGTVGGSLAHADPQGDWGSALLAADARLVVLRSGQRREISLEDFFQGPFTTTLEPNEIITEIRVPDPGPRAAGTYLKLERKVGDFATVAVATHLSLSNGTIGRAGIALTAVGSKNIQATDAEASLAGAEPTDDAFAEAGRLAAEASSPVTDVRGSEAYKRHVVGVYVQRGLARGLEQARAA
jgi:carbon-monoxide dehydrogenase medium subunit